MYSTLIKIYLQLYQLRLIQNKLSSNKNPLLENCLEWTAFVLSTIKKDFIVDLLTYKDEYKDVKFDLFELLSTAMRESQGFDHHKELKFLEAYLTELKYTVKSGYCDKCHIGLWEPDDNDNHICLFHKQHLCKLFPHEHYEIDKVIIA